MMKTYIIGVDGLEYAILMKYLSDLPNFSMIKDKGYLGTINSVFPVDSVPAWLTIYTGLNPAEHGIVRGKNYIESVEDFEKQNNFNLSGNTFWDKLSNKNKKCLILNPFLAYPAWQINGIMISGPSFIDGKTSKYPQNILCNSEVYGGYASMNFGKLKQDLLRALNDTKKLWEEFKTHDKISSFDLSFVLFTTLDRIQHYTWRFYDEDDPLHEKDSSLSLLIKETLFFLDSCLGEIISTMRDDDKLVIISDHGFGRRPYNLLNLNELLRQEGMVKLLKSGGNPNTRYKQKFRNYSIQVFSRLKILDVIAAIVKKMPMFSKYKKSSFLIDKENSLCYVDEYFSGKNAYCGFNFGEKIKESSKNVQQEVFEELKNVLNNSKNIPKPKWIKYSKELYQGKYIDRYPDICMELPDGYGVEFDLFDKVETISVSHYKISGGHRNPGVLGLYSPKEVLKKINFLEEFHDFIISFYD